MRHRFLFLLLCLTATMLARAQSNVFRYWFDQQTSTYTSTGGDKKELSISTSTLSDGLHVLHLQVVDSKGTASAPQSQFFVKSSSTVKGNARYWFDNDAQAFGTLSTTSGVASIDASKLKDGIHTLHVQTDGTAPSAIQTAFFYKTATAASVKEIRYWFDQAKECAKSFSTLSGIVSIDASELSEGIHTLHVQAVGAAPSAIQSAFFIKEASTGAPIRAYEYWVDEQFDARKWTDVSNTADPYCLQTTFPMPQSPFRSQVIALEHTATGPMVFAEHTLHLRFFDQKGRCVEQSAPYLDMASGQAVTEVDTLISSQSITKERPEANAIQWYRFPAKPTDSLRFHVGQNCCVDVFAPSGEKVYSITNFTDWGTFTAQERGVYYLALHDVAEPYAQTTLNYVRIQNVIEVESVTLDKTELVLPLGSTTQLTATVLPDNTTNKTAKWRSTNADVVNVAADGTVTSVGLGEALVIATCDEQSDTCRVSVVLKPGDVNADGSHTVSDVTLTAAHIMGALSEDNTFHAEVADIDRDGMIIVPDLTAIIDFVLDESPKAASARARRMNGEGKRDAFTFGAVQMQSSQFATVDVMLNVPGVAAQFDLILPEGVKLTHAALLGQNAESHDLSFRMVGDDRVRFVLYSLKNRAFSDISLMQLTLQCTNEASEDLVLTAALVNDKQTDGTITEVVASDARTVIAGNDMTAIVPVGSGLSVWAEKNLLVIRSDAARTVTITNAMGMSRTVQVEAGETRLPLPAGIYVVNHKKLLIR